MEKVLAEASLEGDVRRLRSLLSQSPLLLQRLLLPLPHETPLHVAAQAGHSEFVAELLHRVPTMAAIPDCHGILPIHLAAAMGHADIVMQMIAADVRLARAVDGEGRTPLHLAAACGKLEVLRRLTDYDRRLAGVKSTVEGETILGSAVRSGHLHAVRFVAENFPELVREKDSSGNSLLHIAAMSGNRLIVNYLISKRLYNEDEMDVFAGNANPRYNPKELSHRYRLGEVNRVLKRSSATDHYEEAQEHSFFSLQRNEGMKREEKKWFQKKQDSILIVASVIANATFTAGIDHSKDKGQGASSHRAHTMFRFCNTCAFGLSMALFVLLASGGTLRHWVQARIVLIILWASLFFMALSYGAFTMHKDEGQKVSRVSLVFVVFLTLAMLLVMIGHVVVLLEEIRRKNSGGGGRARGLPRGGTEYADSENPAMPLAPMI